MKIITAFNAVLWNFPSLETNVVSEICHNYTLIESWIALGQFTAFVMFFDKSVKILKPLHHAIVRQNIV